MANAKSKRLWDATATIEGMFLIPAPKVPDALLDLFDGDEELPPELHPYVYDWDKDEIEELFGGVSEKARSAWEALFERMFERQEELIMLRAATPVMQVHQTGGSSSSWGCTHLGTVFAPTFDEAIDKVVAWAAESHARDRTKPEHAP